MYVYKDRINVIEIRILSLNNIQKKKKIIKKIIKKKIIFIYTSVYCKVQIIIRNT